MASWLRRSGLSRPFSIQSSRMLKQFGIFVLVSFRLSTLRKGFPEVGNHGRGFSVRQDPFWTRTAHAKCGLYLPAPFTRCGLAGRSF